MSGKPKVWGDTPAHTAIIDWDGTAVPSVWPGHAEEFMPGFEEAMRALHKAGVKLTIFSARLSPWDPWTGKRRPAHVVATETQIIRDMLDRAGLTFVRIWTREGKPGGSVYVDDKGLRYGGRPNSWAAVTEQILTRLGKEDAIFPDFEEVAA